MKKQICTLVALMMIAGTAIAQTKIKDGTVTGSSALPNANAILELESNSRGLLLPRLPLSATNLPSPLVAHIAGMTVYNTATSGTAPTDVTPGWYYNDGTQWVRLAVISSNTNVFGSGAPSGGCSPSTIYTDTLSGSPTAGQQWTCSGGTWVSYTAPQQTEWYVYGGVNDAGANKTGLIQRDAGISINDPAGMSSRIYLRLNKDATFSRRTMDVYNDGTANAPYIRFFREGGPEGTKEFMRIDKNGNVGINANPPAATLEVNGSLKFPAAGTPVAGKVLTTDNAGNATWQASTSFGSSKINATGTFTCPWNGASGGAGFATGMSITIPSDGWYNFETGLTVQSDCNDYYLYINTSSGSSDIWRVYCGASTVAFFVPRDQNRMLFVTAGTYAIFAGKTNAVVPTLCNGGNPTMYIKATKVQN